MAGKASVSVFLGWSGPRSKAIALAFADWLPQVIQAAVPWISEDIERGAQWFAKIGTHLKAADYGLLCVTPENRTEPWVLFEAGALALKTGEAFACPYLLDMAPHDLAGPLVQLQAATADHDGTKKVVATINGLLEDGGARLPEGRLDKVFNQWWPELESKIQEARQVAVAPAAVPARPQGDKLDEILDGVRALLKLESRVTNVSDFIPIAAPLGGGVKISDPLVRQQVMTSLGYVLDPTLYTPIGSQGPLGPLWPSTSVGESAAKPAPSAGPKKVVRPLIRRLKKPDDNKK